MNSTDLAPTSSADLRHCDDMLRRGSLSFHAASRLLPWRVRRSVAPLYAFCRSVDDVIDLAGATPRNLHDLQRRVQRICDGAPSPTPVDRAFARVVHEHQIPRAVLDALLEGFDWEVTGRRYETLSDLLEYAARVASTVGVMMTLIVGRRDRVTLARACELGLAMQLTNIARDVGEDARAGRLYLPLSWLRAEGLDPDRWLANPVPHPAITRSVQRLLRVAAALYGHAESGIAKLPAAVRPAIWAARLIYADIGRVIAANGFDSVTTRAVSSAWAKARLSTEALVRARTAGVPADTPFDMLREVRFLVVAVDGAASTSSADPRPTDAPPRSEAM